jgi:two-component system response regulator PilR (NtrC family)
MGRILVVEDDPDLRFLYQMALGQKGYEVIDAENAKLAMVELENSSFDLVILDLNMPDQPGTAVIDYMVEYNLHDPARVIVITANDHWIDEVLKRNIHHILVKPISINEIAQNVAQIIG